MKRTCERDALKCGGVLVKNRRPVLFFGAACIMMSGVTSETTSNPGRRPAVIAFENVSKRFRFTTERPKTILETVISAFRRPRRQGTESMWALRDLSFAIHQGECVGIVGRNGSGKSTLLKLCTRILRPSSGIVRVTGRVSALLELGTGFHPDLTGRENVYLNASILGLDQDAVDAVFDDIVAFSELDEFIDVPVKNYSSGMYMRLGFSVAIHMDPDILIVDEILAVGDAAFQSKCLARIHDLKRQNKTIVLVSHQLEMLQALCTRIVWMEKGKLRMSGGTTETLQRYLSDTHQLPDGRLSAVFNRWGTGEVELTAVRLLDEHNRPSATFEPGRPLAIEVDFIAHRPVDEPEFGVAIFREEDGLQVAGPNNRAVGQPISQINGEGTLRIDLADLPLLPGRYDLTVALHDAVLRTAYDYHERAYHFRVAGELVEEDRGVVALRSKWQLMTDKQPTH